MALLLLGGAGLLAGSYFLLPHLIGKNKDVPEKPVQKDSVAQVRTEANNLTEGFLRALTLGLAPATVSYGTGGPHDLAGALNLLPPSQAVSWPGLPAAESGRWSLGGGQLIGPYAPEAPDLAFFLAPIPAAACHALNQAAWGRSAGSPVATGVPLSDWAARKANLLEIFDGKNRTEACITTAEGKNLYYRIVYGTTVRETLSDTR